MIRDEDVAMDETDFAQSVVGSEKIVELIQSIPFEKSIYTPALKVEIKRVSIEFFPDVGKRHIVSLDAWQESGLPFDAAPASHDVDKNDVLAYLKERLSVDRWGYLSRLFKQLEEDAVWSERIFAAIQRAPEFLEGQIDQLMKIYPDGKIFSTEINSKKNLTADEILGSYKNVFLGIEPKFPMNFLAVDGAARSAIVTRFAVESIFKKSPLDVLKFSSGREFAEIGMKGILRYFNYSVPKMILNAYPNLVMPWETTHVDEGFWEILDNQKLAVRWLVEEKLAIPPESLLSAIRENRISKADFSKYGLSYLFTQYLRSVSGGLALAYPHLEPWELGSVPNSFWQGTDGKKNISRAIHWLLFKLNIAVHDIPKSIQNKMLTRETFSQFGLATVFERINKKNLPHLINSVFPGHFEIWEIGKAPVDYWDDPLNAYRAAIWVAKKEGFIESEIRSAVRSGALGIELFSKYGLASMIRRNFGNRLRRAFLPFFLEDQKRDDLFAELLVLRMVKKQRKEESILVRLAKRLFFKTTLKPDEYHKKRLYSRMEKRIKKRIAELMRGFE